MENNKHHLEIKIASTLELIDLALLVSEKIAEIAEFDENERFYIRVAIEEALTNAIKHGNKFDSGKKVTVGFDFDDGQVEVSVMDQGTCFDEKETPDPREPENLSKTSGRGLFFIKTFMDEVSFRCHTQQGMEVHMRKNKNGKDH